MQSRANRTLQVSIVPGHDIPVSSPKHRQPKPSVSEHPRETWSAPQSKRAQKVFIKTDSMKRLRMDGALCRSESDKSLLVDEGPTLRLRAGLLQRNEGLPKCDNSLLKQRRKRPPVMRAGLLQKNDPFYITAVSAATTTGTTGTVTTAIPCRQPMDDIILNPCQVSATGSAPIISPTFHTRKANTAETTEADVTIVSTGMNTVSTASTSTASYPSSPSSSSALSVIPVLDGEPKHTVRFHLSSKDDEPFIRPIELTEDEVKSMWWTKEQQKDMKRRARSAATRVLACTQDYRLAVEQLLLYCYHHTCRSNDDSAVSVDTPGSGTPFCYDDAVRIVVNHSARGKEQIMINAFHLESCRFYYKCDKVNVQRVLSAQSTAQRWFQATSLSCLSMEEKEQVAQAIAMEQSKYSAFAAHFSQILAEGDAHAAAGRYDNDPVVSSDMMATLISDDELDEYNDDDETAEDSRVSSSGNKLFMV